MFMSAGILEGVFSILICGEQEAETREVKELATGHTAWKDLGQGRRIKFRGRV